MSKLKNNNIKKYIGCCLALGICTFGSYYIGKEVGLNSALTSKHYPSNKVIATVNGENIYSDKLKANMNILFYMNKNKKYTNEEISKEESQYIEYLTLNKAISKIAIDSGMRADEDAVEENYQSTIKQLSESLYMTEEQILKKFNLTKEEIIESLKEDYLVTKYLKDNSKVLEEEALDYYNSNNDSFIEYRASHILIPTIDSAGNPLLEEEKIKAKEKATSILERIKNGESFEELAKSLSSDSSASNGGDIGYFTKNDVVKEFFNAIEKIEVGQLNPSVIESEFGYHIAKKTDQVKKTFEETKEDILAQLEYEKQSDLVEKIKKESNIEILYK